MRTSQRNIAGPTKDNTLASEYLTLIQKHVPPIVEEERVVEFIAAAAAALLDQAQARRSHRQNATALLQVENGIQHK